MPVEVVLDLPLLSLDKPATLTEAVITNLLAEVGGLQELLEFESLLVSSDIHNHWRLAGVTYQDSEKLGTGREPLFCVLVEPLSLPLHVAQVTGMLLGVF